MKLSAIGFAVLIIVLTAILLEHLLLYTPKEQNQIVARQTQLLENQKKILRMLCFHSYHDPEQLKECERLVSEN